MTYRCGDSPVPDAFHQSPRLARLMTDDVSPLGIMGLPPEKQPVPSY
jgi:hypothetical protein